MSRSDNWFLVEFGDGGRGVVYSKSVLNPVTNDVNIGDMVTVNWRGDPKAGTLIARAINRDQLEAECEQDNVGVNSKVEEDVDDYSASGSSWAPSDADDGAISGDSYKECAKKPKLEKCQRQYINRRSTKKILVPSHRANAVIPKAMQGNSKQSDVGRKRTRNETTKNGSFNKSLPDSTKTNNVPQGKHMVSVDIKELEEIGNNFRLLFKMIDKLKHPCNNVNESYILPTIQSNETAMETAEDYVENEQYDHEEEFNRSDDNVLITNKYDNTQYEFHDESAVNEPYKARVKINDKSGTPGEEWIPIGSGKTLIHADQFKKVNWKSYTIATRTLLLAVFPRRILATHSLTGKRSPAFMNKPAKMCLDPKIISDVIIEIMDRFNVKENLVRSIITTKCADECKMLKQKNKKSTPINNNQENVAPKKSLDESKVKVTKTRR